MKFQGYPMSAAEREMAAKIMGMLDRGDAVEDIAVWFGLHIHTVQFIQSGAVHHLVSPAPAYALPPAGPYNKVRSAYHALENVRAAERELHRLAADLRQSYHA